MKTLLAIFNHHKHSHQNHQLLTNQTANQTTTKSLHTYNNVKKKRLPLLSSK